MRITKKNMIESQLKPEGISCLDTIDCISKVNREDFVPKKYIDSSYAEFDIPLDNDYLMLRPITVAKILQLLAISKKDEILEIGTGTGYLTCCLSILGKSVDTVDIDAEMQANARISISNYNLYNIRYANEDVFSDWAPKKKYDVIVLTGSIDSRIKKLEDSLNLNGRMFAVTGSYPVMDVNILNVFLKKSSLLIRHLRQHLNL